MKKIINWLKKLFNIGTGSKVPQSNSSVDVPVKIPLGTDMSTPDITLGTITGATVNECKMIAQAVDYVRQVVSSSEFREAVIYAKFTNTNGLSNQQIYDLFTKTKLLVNVDMFDGSWKQNHVWHTMGYEDPNDDFVHANRYFIQDALTMGSLILHELSHEPLGFHHNSASDSSSVPYTMNRIFESVAEKLGIKQVLR